MTALPHADLSGLVRGELPTDDVTASGEHVHGCDACRDDLLPIVLGHALLARSARTLGTDAVEPRPLPSMAELDATAPGRPPRPALRLLVVAAALTAAAGVGAVSQAQLSGDDDQNVAEPQRSATLQAVAGAGSPVGGTVAMTEASGRTSMTITTHDLPSAEDGQFYYAWLLDPETDKMLPLGQVGPSGSASFEVSDRLLAEYTAVDVSLEADDGDPQHSPTSVLRALYA